MEKNIPDERILDYLDGLLDPENTKDLEALSGRSPEFRKRVEELRSIHDSLRLNSRLEVPSRNFTERVMEQLDSAQTTRGFSPRNGLLLLCGILVAAGIALVLLESGTFDGANGILSLDTLPLQKDWIKSMPSIPFHGKWIVNALLIIATGVSFVLLDRTVLRPYFERRSGMI